MRAEVPTVVPPEPKSNATTIAILVGVVALLAGAGYAFYAMQPRPPGPRHPRRSVPSDRARFPVRVPAARFAVRVRTSVRVRAPSPTPSPRPPPQPPSPRPRPRPRAHHPHPRSPSPPLRPLPPPPLPLLPAPSSPRAFDPSAARAALDVMNGVLASCRNPGGRTGQGSITVTFTPDGRADRAMVDEPPFSGTPEATCVSSRFKQAKMAPFEGAPGSIVYTFTIPN